MIRATVSITTPTVWPISKRYEVADLDELLATVKAAIEASEPAIRDHWRSLSIEIKRVGGGT